MLELRTSACAAQPVPALQRIGPEVEMPIKDLMSCDVEVVGPSDSIAQAAAKMWREEVGFLPVCDGERLVGTLTDRDITVRATARGLDPNETRVGEVMTAEVAWCYEDEDIARVIQLMKEKQIRRIPVVSRDKRLTGVVALGDLARQQESQSADVLESVSQAPPNT